MSSTFPKICLNRILTFRHAVFIIIETAQPVYLWKIRTALITRQNTEHAGYQAMDYRMKSATMNKNQKLSVKMARNGGFAAVLE